MTTDVLNGGVPALPSEPATPAAAQPNAATANPQTGGEEGGTESQVTRTYTEQEHRDAIERATAKAAAKAERRAFREAAARLASQHSPQQASQPAQNDDGRPTPRQGETTEAYLDRLTDWKLEQREQRAQAERQHEQNRTLAKKIDGLYEEAEKLPGFDRDTFEELPLSRAIVEALIESDMPAKLMAYMAAHPEDVERIAKLSPGRQGAEIGKLEAKAAETKPPARSGAPTALSPAKGSPGANAMPDPTDTKAYIRWANEQERAALR